MLYRVTRTVLAWAVRGLMLQVLGQVPGPVLVNHTGEGDVTLGGMGPFHFGPACQGELGLTSVEVAETIIFAVRQVNERADLLPNVTLGFDVRETCYDEDMALLSALTLLGEYSHPGDPVYEVTGLGRPPATGNLVGVIGTSQSATSLAVAKPFSLYGVPMISYSATSDELSNKDRFPLFLRTVPPDMFQARAIVDILVHFDWVYIGVIYSMNTYGILGTQELLRLAEKEDVCVAFSVVVREHAAPSEVQEIVQKIEKYDRAKVLVMFGEFSEMYEALQRFHDANPLARRTLICSDAFGPGLKLYNFTSMIQGSIDVRLNFQTIPGIREYFSDVLPGTRVSPWYTAFKETWLTGACSNLTACPLPFSGTWMPIYLSVYTFAYALDDLIRETCPGMMADCTTSFARSIRGRQLMPYLLNVTFQGPEGKFGFDADGNPTGSYHIRTVDSGRQGQPVWRHVGFWDSRLGEDALFINASAVEWPGADKRPPVSVCRDECERGYIEVPRKEKCCWTCRQCLPDERVVDNECVACPRLFWPSEDFTSCVEIVPTTINPNDAVPIIILVLSSTGVALSASSLAGMLFYRKHPLIKATGREVSFVTIVGTFMAFLAVLPFLVYPSDASCAACEAMVSLCLTLTYAPTLLKVSRIYRIFKAGKKTTRPPRLTRPKDQVLLVALLTTIQVVIVAVSGITGNLSTPELITTPARPDSLEIYCLFQSGFIASCVYNLLLVLACCYYAFKTRKVPSNYNESNFIAVSVYSTLILCLAAVPVYSTAVSVLHKVATICIALQLNAYLTLVCVYLPKLYAARFVTDVVLLQCSHSADGESCRVHPLAVPRASELSETIPPADG